MVRSRRARRLLDSLAFAAWLALASHAAGADATTSAPAAQRVVRDGVAVEFSLLPANAATPAAPRAGETARVRFTITDTTGGKPLTRLRPAAWFSRRATDRNDLRPQTAAEKVQELLGGSIFSRAELDLNSFRVLALNDDATITVVDPLFGFGGTKLLAMIALPGVGADWILTPEGTRLFVSVPTANQVAVIDPATWKTTALLEPGLSPRRVVLQPDAHYAWVACDGERDGTSAGVSALAADGSAVVAHIATGRGPHEIAFSADSRWAFVANATAQTLSIIDVRTLKKTKDLPLGCVPAALAYSRLSEALYLTDEAGGKIVVVDAVKHELIARLPAEPGVVQVKFTSGGRFGLVAVPTRDLVLVLDAATNRIVQRARIEHAPEQFAFAGDLAFVRRRGTASVAMIPLKEIGREGQPLAVAEFTGGEAPFGLRTSAADSIVQASGESAVVVANPSDKTIYYYMPGMAAPMGNFSNYDRQPCAVLVLDRSLREVSPGVYESAATLPAAGDYDVVFFLDSPRIAHSFATTIQPHPARASAAVTARLEPVPRQNLAFVAGQPARVGFRLQNGASQPPPADLSLRAVLAPGTWHSRLEPQFAADGSCSVEFTPPDAGIYYFYAESPALGRALSNAPCLVLHVAAAPSVPSK